jgi:hypothetical protein
MSCSADYYFVFWSGSADYYFEESTYTVLRVPQCLSPSLEVGPPHPLSRKRVCPPPPNHKKCAKMYFCKHWQHLLVGAEVLVAPTSIC